MFGVVLWSDQQEQKAVIWCEDQGDLAFYRNVDDDARIELDAGDWVQFDMTVDRHMRRALNPRLIAEGVFPEIADVLNAAGDGPNLPNAIRPGGRFSAEIVPFRQMQTAPPRRATGGEVVCQA